MIFIYLYFAKLIIYQTHGVKHYKETANLEGRWMGLASCDPGYILLFRGKIDM